VVTDLHTPLVKMEQIMEVLKEMTARMETNQAKTDVNLKEMRK
jgi:hypothetical protein